MHFVHGPLPGSCTSCRRPPSRSPAPTRDRRCDTQQLSHRELQRHAAAENVCPVAAGDRPPPPAIQVITALFVVPPLFIRGMEGLAVVLDAEPEVRPPQVQPAPPRAPGRPRAICASGRGKPASNSRNLSHDSPKDSVFGSAQVIRRRAWSTYRPPAHLSRSTATPRRSIRPACAIASTLPRPMNGGSHRARSIAVRLGVVRGTPITTSLSHTGSGATKARTPGWRGGVVPTGTTHSISGTRVCSPGPRQSIPSSQAAVRRQTAAPGGRTRATALARRGRRSGDRAST